MSELVSNKTNTWDGQVLQQLFSDEMVRDILGFQLSATNQNDKLMIYSEHCICGHVQDSDSTRDTAKPDFQEKLEKQSSIQDEILLVAFDHKSHAHSK